ncbi:MAG TPA: hypothetical protein PKD09_10670 [Aggregatilinea sp.]|uniref:hypothetical protein n=1 Tax=Aggregatilinea sp. TaxID=2806333 RepID=UPI002BC4130E|nr:hypothetical protein [Aggregatilinea sp.]HML22106.1 hypothetical protein [Aggregatilinea sp.]
MNDVDFADRTSNHDDERLERLDMLDEARGYIDEAVRLIREATRGTTEEAGARAYVIPTLKMCAGNDHEYLANQPYNIEELRAALQE